jgi:hypothetical protein
MIIRIPTFCLFFSNLSFEYGGGQTKKTHLSLTPWSGHTDICLWNLLSSYFLDAADNVIFNRRSKKGESKIGKGFTILRRANFLKQVIIDKTCLSPVQTDLSPLPTLLSRPVCLLFFSIRSTYCFASHPARA